MQIKLKDIVFNVENIKKLLENKLPVKVSYRLRKLAVKVEKEYNIYSETKNSLILELGTKQEDNTFTIKVTDDKFKEYNEKHNELLEQTVEIDFEPIDIEELGDVVVSPNELVEWIFK